MAGEYLDAWKMSMFAFEPDVKPQIYHQIASVHYTINDDCMRVSFNNKESLTKNMTLSYKQNRDRGGG